MSTVEIIVMFEDNRKQREEEARKQEEARIVSKIEALQELEELIDEAKAEAEKLKDELKAEMKKRDVEELKAGKYILRWTEYISNRFDSSTFKKLFPTTYAEFTKNVTSRRFTISK